MKILNVHDAKMQITKLLADVEERGEEVLICRDGKPVADLVPHRKRDRLTPHPAMSKITISYDPIEPMSDDEWPESKE